VTALACGDVETDAHSTGVIDDLFGIEPTGEGFTVDGVDVFAVADGRTTDVHAQWEPLTMVQKPGVVSAMESTMD
jgi:hypothetical protein